VCTPLPDDEPFRIARLVSPGHFDVVRQSLGRPAVGQVAVRILSCGVCASELHAVQDSLESYPVSIGHEPIGVVEAVGSGVEGLREGMRVTGGFGPSFAERVLADHRHVVAVPDGVATNDAIGEPLGCVVEGKRRTRVVAGDRVAIAGVGYMGLMMLQLVVMSGAAETVVIDPRADARDAALAFGATEALAPEEIVGNEADGEFDVVIEASGTQAGLDLATGLVRQHGILSILGYHQGPRSVDVQQWNWKAIDVVNAHVRRRDLLNEAIRRGLELIRLGRLQHASLVTHRFGLDGVGEAFQALATKPEGFIKAVVDIG
jgi:2-desacetyl-2-hydroxyethyl bacteriochlorophyllide A dehydrogenase